MSTLKGITSNRRTSSKQDETLSMLEHALNNISEGSDAGNFATACHDNDNNNIIYDNDKIIFGTWHSWGLKGSLKKIESKIKIILSSENYGSIKLLIPAENILQCL